MARVPPRPGVVMNSAHSSAGHGGESDRTGTISLPQRTDRGFSWKSSGKSFVEGDESMGAGPGRNCKGFACLN